MVAGGFPIPLPTLPHAIYLFILGFAFVHFLQAGIRTFARSGNDDWAATWAQTSFIGTGSIATWFLGLNQPIHLHNGFASGAMLLCSLALYEWARHTIWGRRFYTAWSGAVPEELCDRGPYAWIRHPIYTSYLVAFLAVLIALPSIYSLAMFIVNAVLFGHAMWSDERSLARSPLAASFAEYKKRTGMFFPRIFGAQRPRSFRS